MSDKDCTLGEFSNLLGCCLRRQAALNVLVGDAVHLGADDTVAGVNKAAPAVGDLATLDLHCSDFDKIRNLRIKAGRLSVNDHKGAAVRGCLSKRQHAVGAWLDVGNALLLANLGAELLLQGNERLDGVVSELNGLGHLVFGDQVGAGLDHHDRADCA